MVKRVLTALKCMGMVGLVAARAHDLTSKYLPIPYLGYFPTTTHHFRSISHRTQFIELHQFKHSFQSKSRHKTIQVSPMTQID
jgi:hypothetical protein